MPDTAQPLADLTLARLIIPGKKPPAPGAIRKDLAPLIRGGWTKERVGAVLADLRSKGWLPEKGQTLTEAGRDRALVYLGLAELPPKCNWGTIRAKFLVPKALGLTPWSEAEVARVGTTDKLAARLLKAKYALPVSAEANLTGVLEALVCRLIGYPALTTLKELTAVMLSREANAEPVLPVKDVNTVAPRLLLGAIKGGIEGFRAVVLNGTFEDAGETTPLAKPAVAPPNGPPEIQAFAERVTEAAKSCPTGWFGDDLVFISHVWRHMRRDPEFAALDLPDFKTKLLAANRVRSLALSRADLVQAMGADDVRESETSYLNSVFHFILIRKGT